ncbi:scarecrow-like protein 30 [Rosa rugosa]|uniref:scarecrow-like protein 30 n=1 Tax=Rosa rugosa TaxID=74645 RepID=UPI002B410659|nr:scarecrow-like protein 30 [Rosa rugosa]
MDTLFDRFSGPIEGFYFGHDPTSITFNPNLANKCKVTQESTNTLIHPANLDHPSDLSTSLSPASEEETVDVSYSNNPVIKYISDILLDEVLEDESCMLQDYLAVQAAEKSFYDVLNPNDPHSPNKASLGESFSDTLLVSDSLFESQSLGNFGNVGEANKFLPNGEFDIIDKERYELLPVARSNLVKGNLASDKKNDVNNPTDGMKGKKNHHREDGYYPEEGRSSKQSVVSADDSEPQEMFDKVLLCQAEHHHRKWESCTPHCSMKREETEQLQQNRQPKGSETNRSKRQNKDEEGVDLTTMLNQCAQAVASYEQGTASELLKKIRQHSSPHGHATQRLAHYFANGLEARLTGVGTPSFAPLFSRQTSAAEYLLAYQVYTTSCPFKMMSQLFANRTIMKLAKNETRLHIIDFGISFGFQWPFLIQHLSERPNGPPKLHITGIELPQRGFRPRERVEETGHRLARYCEKFNVPFEYDVIAQGWETIQCEDLKIDRNELVVVNCLNRLKHIHDETVMENSPRDTVLNLIKNIDPDLFIHGIVNGTYNTPFFATRFKEALLHYYALFDMFEATVPREDERRMIIEREKCGRDIMNIVACEGVERFERPETYKKWQIRNVRAGLKQLPLDQEELKKVRKLYNGYHNDFRVEEDGQWILQGWKGRILRALSLWTPA